MDKLSVILDRRDMVISLEGKSLRMDAPDSKTQRVPLGMIGEVIVYGNPLVRSDVWRALADLGVPAALLPFRGGSGPAWLGSGLSSSVIVRIAQHKAIHTPELRSTVVQWILQKKLEGQSRLANILFQSITDNNPLMNPAAIRKRNLYLGREVSNTIARNIELLAYNQDVEALRGLEGNCSRAWFGMLAKVLHKRWSFAGRNRRPPEDPVNSLLSLTYTMLMSEASREVHKRGLDPCVGFLHTPYPGRVSLVLDIMEPLRPEVDFFVLGLLDNVLKPKHFYSNAKDGCRLNKEGRELYFRSWTYSKEKNWPSLMGKETLENDLPSENRFIELHDADNEDKEAHSPKNIRTRIQHIIRNVVSRFCNKSSISAVQA
jgi:CRISP-associated protein Cas1